MDWGDHHMGTTRMQRRSANRAWSMPNSKVHGVGNLFVAGSSVFPTYGASNPTMNLVALTLRLADPFAESSSHEPAAQTHAPRADDRRRSSPSAPPIVAGGVYEAPTTVQAPRANGRLCRRSGQPARRSGKRGDVGSLEPRPSRGWCDTPDSAYCEWHVKRPRAIRARQRLAKQSVCSSRS